MRLDNLALKFERFLEVLCGILLGVIVAIVAYQVFGRYVLNRSPSWSEELCGMLFAWMTMLGSASCLRAGRHLSISALVAAVSARVRNVLLWLRDAAILAAFGILGVASYRFAMMNADQESPTLEVPLTLHYSAVIVGTVLMALLLILSRYLGRPIPLEQVDDGAVSL